MAYKIWFIFANSPNLKITVRSKLNIVQSETTAEAKLPGLGEKFDVKLDVYLAAPKCTHPETVRDAFIDHRVDDFRFRLARILRPVFNQTFVVFQLQFDYS